MSTAYTARDAPVVQVRGGHELTDIVRDWDELAASAVEPNPFYESWMLRPALESLGNGRAVHVVLIYDQPKGPPRPRRQPILVGLFPLVVLPPERAMPLPRLGSWLYPYAFSGTPLIHVDHGAEVMAALFDWFATQTLAPGPIELSRFPGDGPMCHLLIDELDRRGAVSSVRHRFTRAVLRRSRAGTGSEDSLERARSSKHRKELRRLRKRLADHGAVVSEWLEPGASVDDWLRELCDLEASGWKARAGTALACDPAHLRFFRAAAREAHRRGRLELGRLRAGEQVIASKLNFVSGRSGFAFRIAFDERFARYSPGVLLEVDAMDRFFASDLDWIDSCAQKDHPMIEHLWPERRSIEQVLVSTNRFGDLVLSALPLAQLAGRTLRRLRSNHD